MTFVYDEALPTTNSTAVRKVYYNNQDRNLYVALVSGGCYAYPDVPQAVFQSLVRADSVGQAFHVVKKHYGPSTKVNENHLLSRDEQESIHQSVGDAFGMREPVAKAVYYDLERGPVGVQSANEQRVAHGQKPIESDETSPLATDAVPAPNKYAFEAEYHFYFEELSGRAPHIFYGSAATVDEAIALVTSTAEAMSQYVSVKSVTFEV